jgi:hypothetical protein
VGRLGGAGSVLWLQVITRAAGALLFHGAEKEWPRSGAW